jgi:hypothetical protein
VPDANGSWHRDEPRRKQIVPGEAFADAGGLEECVPTIRGNPDHGDAWSRAWTVTGDDESRITCPDFELTRRIEIQADSVVADYRLAAEPGYRFLWAGHALLDLSPNAHLLIDQGTTTRVFPHSSGAEWIEGAWPTPAGFRLDTLGPDDGSAIGAVIDTASAVVDDGPDRLRLSLQVTDQPASVALWRNLGGFPAGAPYRSIGVEPMLGRVFDLAHAESDGDCAITPSSGEVRWRLTITAYRLKE